MSGLKTITCSCGLLALVVGVLAGTAQGDTLVLYNGQNPDTSNQTGASPWAANTVGSGVVAGNLTANKGTQPVGINTEGVDTTASHTTQPYYRATTYTDVDNTTPDDGPGSPQQATAITNGAYFSFTLSGANVGDLLELTSITYDIAQGTTSTGQERGYALYSSLDGYTTALAADAAIDAVRPNWFNGNVNLGSVQVASVTFRLYLFVGDGAGIGSNIDFDNIQVNGSYIPVPEPASLALLAAAGACGFLRRRR